MRKSKTTVAPDPKIALYFHCGRCLREGLTANIAVGFKHGGEFLRIWCDTHQKLLSDFALRHPAQNLKCECCGEPVEALSSSSEVEASNA
jgi:hypothetical protein